MKAAALALALAMAGAAQATTYPPAPLGYVGVAQSDDSTYTYVHIGTIAPQVFTRRDNNSKLAVGNMWQYPSRNFSRIVANCSTWAVAQVRMGAQGIEQAGNWVSAIEGTVAGEIAFALCAVAYPKDML